jgi:hypothetical protein
MTTVSASALPVQGLLGRWRAQNTILGPDVQFLLYFTFDLEFTTQTVQCLYLDGSSLIATTSAYTNYLAHNIYIQETRQAVVNDGYRFCRSTLQPSMWRALFDVTGRMVLILPAPYQTQLTLIREY